MRKFVLLMLAFLIAVVVGALEGLVEALGTVVVLDLNLILLLLLPSPPLHLLLLILVILMMLLIFFLLISFFQLSGFY